MSWRRSSSFGACRLSASVMGRGTSASFRMAAGRPTVEIVILRALMPKPHGALSAVTARMTLAEIGQRLAHPHEDDVGDALDPGQCSQMVDLFDDLPRAQVALEAIEARCAEPAPDRATDLAGDARGAAVAGRDHDALRGCLVLRSHRQQVGWRRRDQISPAEQELLRPVAGLLRGAHRSAEQRQRASDLRCRAAGQVGHPLGIDLAVPVHPLEQLGRDVSRQVRPLEVTGQLLGIQVEEVKHVAVLCDADSKQAVERVLRQMVI